VAGVVTAGINAFNAIEGGARCGGRGGFMEGK
jgi:hypothetical protein